MSIHLDAKPFSWQCAEKTICQAPCEGLDKSVNPLYRRTNEEIYKNSKEFPRSRLRGLFYLPGEDTHIAGGAPTSEENACNLFVCHDNWSDVAKRKVRWSVKVPQNDKKYTPETSYGGDEVQAIFAYGTTSSRLMGSVTSAFTPSRTGNTLAPSGRTLTVSKAAAGVSIQATR